MWLQWFKTAGSGVEWLELATVKRECHQLYKQYKGEEWVCPFDVHFALVDPSLEFLMDDLMAGMTVSAPAVASASDTTKHPVGVLAVARGEGWRKGKAKARDEEDKDIEEQIEEMFTDKCLATLLCWQKALTVVDTGLGAGVKLEKAKGKVTVLLAKRQEYKCMQGACDNCWANNDPEGCYKEGEGDMEMRETTPLATVTEVEQEASDMEVEGKEELKVVSVATEEDKEEESAEEVEGTWSDMPLCQVGDNKLEWLGENLSWPTPLTSVASLVDFNERVAGVEWQFQRELEAAREELLAAQAWYTVAKQMLATLAGYQHDCQAFLAW
ncbi:hypothetical protein J132_09167 [Termitomyces sp. J132]|nr:hypothetical protein J132_09167 [Termitomyces sp. J132]